MKRVSRPLLALTLLALTSFAAPQSHGQDAEPVYSEELLMRPVRPMARAGLRPEPIYSEELLMRPVRPVSRTGFYQEPIYAEELLMHRVSRRPTAARSPAEPVYSEELLMRPVKPMGQSEPLYSEELLMRPVGSLSRTGNPQQPPALPTDPLAPGTETPLLIFPDEMPLLNAGEYALPPLPEAMPPASARSRLQFAQHTAQPILPLLAPGGGAYSFAQAPRVLVKQFVFEGNHVFSTRELAKVVAPYTDRMVTTEDLEEARVALTKHYIEAGYITSGAILPDQDVESGVVKMQIVEGRLTDIDVRGNYWYRNWWLRHQLRRAAGKPLNFTKLKLGLQLLRQEPTIARINAEVMPGAKPGESVLEFVVKDQQPFRFGFELSNKRPPSVSEGLGEIYFTDLNLTGHGDPLALRWGLLRWQKDGLVEYADFDNLSAAYEFPVSPWGTTLGVHAARSDSSIIDETFAELGITSRSEEFGLALRQPLYETLANTVSVSLIADRKHSETFLLGQPFTLSLGALDGETDVFATRAAIEWVNRSQRHVLALRSVFSFGFHALGSTRADPRTAQDSLSGGAPLLGLDPEIPDSKFFHWLGQAQLVARIADTANLRAKPDTTGWNLLRETQLVVRGNVQLSDEPLLSLEQFSIGGMQSVRGYRENQLLRDNGVFASVELRVPLWLAKDKSPIVALAPFVDFGTGWNVNKLEDNSQTVFSAGIGLLVKATKHAQLTLYWGHPFVDLQEQKSSLQDYGFHFAVTINAF